MSDYTWLGGDGAWNTAADWTPAGIPGAGDNALITATGTYTVTVSAKDDSVDDLTTSADITLAIGKDDMLEAAGVFENAGIVTIAAGGKLRLDAALTTAQLGKVEIAPGGTLDLEGTLDNAGATFDAAAGTQVVGGISGGTIEGTLMVGTSEGGSLQLGASPKFEGAGGVGAGEIKVTGTSNTLTFSGTQTIGDVTIEMGYVNVSVPSQDQLSATAGALTLGATTTIDEVGVLSSLTGVMINNGSIVVNSAANVGYLILSNATLTNNGSIAISADDQFQLGLGTFVDSGAISGNGQLLLGGGTSTTLAAGARVSVAQIYLIGDLTVAEDLDYGGYLSQDSASTLTISDDDTFTMTGTSNPTQISTFAGVLDGAGDLALSGGEISIAKGAAITVSNWSITGPGATVGFDDLTYAGAFTVSAGPTGGAPVQLSGKLTLTGNASFSDAVMIANLFTTGTTLVSGGVELQGNVHWTNEGTATESDGYLTVGGVAGSRGQLYNTSAGVFVLAGDSGVALLASSSSEVVNAGLFEKTGLAGVSIVEAIVNNTGKIEVASGTLDLRNQLWGIGAVEVGADGTLEFGDAPGATATSTEYVNGDLALDAGSTLTLAGVNLGLTGRLDLTDATLNGADRLFTHGATQVSGLTIGGTAVWANKANATESGGDVTAGDASGGVAILYNVSGGIYDITDDSGIALGASTSRVNNAGSFEKTGGAGASVIAANVGNSGTIAATSGTLDFQAALSGTGKADVSNGATLEVDGDVGAAQSLVFSGAGTIALHDLDVAGVKLFHGAISGFGAADSLDVGTAFGAGTVPTFWENPSLAFGYLTLTNGSTSATIKLLGDYATTSFTPSVNASGATVLTYHA